MQRFLMYLFLQTLYMFQAVPSPIIRSTELYIELQVLSTNTAASCYRGWDGTAPPIIRSTELYIELQVLATNTAASCYRGWDATAPPIIRSTELYIELQVLATNTWSSMYSSVLLMMGGGTAWNRYSVCRNRYIKKRCILLAVIWK